MRMSRYYLRVVGSDTKFRDENGKAFDTPHDATARATKIAAELAQTGTGIGDSQSRLPMKTNNEVTLVIRDLSHLFGADRSTTAWWRRFVGRE